MPVVKIKRVVDAAGELGKKVKSSVNKRKEFKVHDWLI